MKKKLAYIGFSFALPLLTFAQYTVTNATGVKNAVLDIINNILVPLIFAVAFLVFVWGVFKFFILGAHDEEKRGEGKNLMIWGLIGFFVMVSVWGLVNILTGTFSTDNSLNTGSGSVRAPF